MISALEKNPAERKYLETTFENQTNSFNYCSPSQSSAYAYAEQRCLYPHFCAMTHQKTLL